LSVSFRLIDGFFQLGIAERNLPGVWLAIFSGQLPDQVQEIQMDFGHIPEQL
jgi:hypothetical protein